MSAFDRDQIECKILLELYDFWDNSRGANKLMAATDVDPSKIGNCLPSMIILDVVGDPRRFRYRFTGTAIDGVNGQFRTGKYLDEIDLGGRTKKTIAAMHETIDRREPTYFLGEFIARDDRILRYERIAMPLTSDGKTVTSILVGLKYLRLVESHPTPRYESLPVFAG